MTIRNLLLSASVAFTGISLATPANAGADPLLGEIMEVGYTFCPRGWANADGQLLAISQYSALFSLYGTTYGGDGRTTFALPDLRGRASIHTGSGVGLSPKALGSRGGTESLTVLLQNLPNHSHRAGIRTNLGAGDTHLPKGNAFTQQGNFNAYSTEEPNENGMNPGYMNPKTVWVEPTGTGQSISKRSPYLTTRKCVALQGIFPSRN